MRLILQLKYGIVSLLLTISLFSYGFDAIVDPGYQQTNVSTDDKSIIFSNIGAALNAAPASSDKPFKIYISAGNYYEKLVINKPNIQLIGAGQDKTRIYHDTYAGQVNPSTGKNWGTWESATVIIRATDFVARYLHIENTFNYPANDVLPKNDPNKISGSQAVALMTDTGSDRAMFEQVTLSGYQDTLFALAGRSLFINSVIKGHVDFIFGAGTAVFLNSDIITRARTKPIDPVGYITAPSTQINQPFGLIFNNSRLLREPGVADESVSLGRPWHPTTTFPDGRYADPNAIGQTVFLNCWMDAHIKFNPWFSMGGWLADGTRTQFQPEDARFFEYGSVGPGAHINEKRPQLDQKQVDVFTLKNIFGEWNPL